MPKPLAASHQALPETSWPPPPTRVRPEPVQAGECRCLCGSLLARLVPGGVELKCRRCKRTHFLPLEGDEAAAPRASQRFRPAETR